MVKVMWKSALFILTISYFWGFTGVAVALIILYFLSPSNEDDDEIESEPVEDPKHYEGESKPIKFLYLVSAAMAKVAKADGTVTDNEINRVMENFKSLEINNDELKLAQRVFNEEKDSSLSLCSIIEQFNESYERIEGTAVMLYGFLFLVATANGFISPEQKLALVDAEELLELPEGTTDKYLFSEYGISPEASSTESTYFSILGISSSATEKELKAAYRKKCKEMHPDTLLSKNVPPEVLSFANEQMRIYREAYESLRAQLASI
mgnify:CR=1 FL=1